MEVPDLRRVAEIGEPKSQRRIKSMTERSVLGEPERFIYDVLGRVWAVPFVQNRHGQAEEGWLSHPLELYFGDDGRVTHAVHLHPYYDKNVPLTDQEQAMSQMLGVPPANAGWNEPYEGDDRV
jgi:hypothetical protein